MVYRWLISSVYLLKFQLMQAHFKQQKVLFSFFIAKPSFILYIAGYAIQL